MLISGAAPPPASRVKIRHTLLLRCVTMLRRQRCRCVFAELLRGHALRYERVASALRVTRLIRCCVSDMLIRVERERTARSITPHVDAYGLAVTILKMFIHAAIRAPQRWRC